MLNLAPPAGTAVRAAKIASRVVLTIILFVIGFIANAVLHETVAPVCKAVLSTAGTWLPVIVIAAIVIVLVLERTRNLKL